MISDIQSTYAPLLRAANAPGKPSCLQMTPASVRVQWSSQMVPHMPL